MGKQRQNTKGRMCPHCGHDRVWKRPDVPCPGGTKDRYICKKCGKSFYGSDMREAIRKRNAVGNRTRRKK